MAKKKRKRINKPVFVLLLLLGGVSLAAAGVLGWGFYRYGGAFPKRLSRMLFPEDPAGHEARGDRAYEKRDWSEALDAYDKAIERTPEGDLAGSPPPRARRYFKYGRTMIEQALQAGGLTDTERGEKYRQGLNWLHRAITLAPEYVEPHRLLCELEWRAVARNLERAVDGEGTLAQRDASLERFVVLANVLIGRASESKAGLDADSEDAARLFFRRGLAHTQLYSSLKGVHHKLALEDLREAARRKPGQPPYWGTLVEFLLSLERPAEARAALDKALLANPDSLVLHIRSAELLWQEGKKDQALAHLKDLVARRPGNVDSWLALAKLHVAGNQLAQARQALQTAREPTGDDPRILAELADVHLGLRQVDLTVELLRSALAREQAATRPATGPAARRRHTEAVRRMAYMLASILLDQAQIQPAGRAEKVAEARALTPLAARDRPDSPEARKLEGRLALFDGNLSEAAWMLADAWSGFQRKKSAEPQTALLLASVLLRQNQPVKAEGVLDQVLRQVGQSRNVRFLLAKAQIRLKMTDREGAAALVARVREVDPGNAEALALESTLKALAGRGADLPKTIANPRVIVRQLRDLAETLWFEDQRAEATQLLADLHDRLPDDLDVAGHLADLYLAQGQADLARALLEKAAARHAGDESLKFRLELLKQDTQAGRVALRRRRAEALADPYRRELELAGVARIENQPAEHVRHLLAALKHKPDAPGLATFTLRRATALRQWDQAEQCVALAAEKDLDGQKGLLLSARLALARYQSAAASEMLSKILARSPGHVEALALKGRAHLQANQLTQAEAAFTAVLKADPSDVAAVVGMVTVTQVAGREDDHARWVARATQLAPRDRYLRQRHLAVRAKSATDKRQLLALLDECERLLRKTPPGQQLELRAIGADLMERTGQIRQAEAELQSVYEQAADKLAGATLLVQFLIRTGQSAKADGVLGRLLRETTDRVGAYVLYGLALSLHSPDQAVSAFGKALEIGPRDPRVHLAISRHHSRQGNWRPAADAMARYVDLAGMGPQAQKELVLLRLEAGQYELAARRLAPVLKETPHDARALTLQGFLLRKTGQADQAEALWARAIQADEDYALPRVFRAQLHLDQGRPAEALADLERARKQGLAESNVRLQLAVEYRRLGEAATVEAVLTDLLRAHPTYLPAMRELASLYVSQKQWYKLEPRLVGARRAFPRDLTFLLAEAGMWAHRGQNDRRTAALAGAHAAAPQSGMVLRAYLEALLAGGKYEQAWKVATNTKSHPLLGPWAEAAGAVALAKLARPEEAEKAFLAALGRASADQVADIGPFVAEAYGPAAAAKLAEWARAHADPWRLQACLGELHARQGRDATAGNLSSAETAFRAAAKLAGRPADQAAVLRRLALVLNLAGQDKQAARTYLESLRLQGESVAGHNNLAYLYNDGLGQPDQALPHAEKAFALSPGDPTVLDTYGWVLAKLGRFDQAERRLQQAVLRDQPTGARRFHLGWVLEHRPQPALARAHMEYTQALALIDRENSAALHARVAEALARVARKMASRGR